MGNTTTTYYYGGAIALSIGFVILSIWLCKDKKRGGRVIAPPPQPEPVKPTPPPYSFSEYDRPPLYDECVPQEVQQQQQASGRQQTQTGQSSAYIPTAPWNTSSPSHVVHIPENTSRY